MGNVPLGSALMNTLCYGDSLGILRRHLQNGPADLTHRAHSSMRYGERLVEQGSHLGMICRYVA